MGLMITLTVQQVDDVVFDDVQAMNDELMAAGCGELYEEMTSEPDFTGPIKVVSPNEVQLASRWDSDWNGYSDHPTMIWGCWDLSEHTIIASHLQEGKLVLFEEVEGNDNIFWIITPGKVSRKDASDLRF
jgi:hypothetical protein